MTDPQHYDPATAPTSGQPGPSGYPPAPRTLVDLGAADQHANGLVGERRDTASNDVTRAIGTVIAAFREREHDVDSAQRLAAMTLVVFPHLSGIPSGYTNAEAAEGAAQLLRGTGVNTSGHVLSTGPQRRPAALGAGPTTTVDATDLNALVAAIPGIDANAKVKLLHLIQNIQAGEQWLTERDGRVKANWPQDNDNRGRTDRGRTDRTDDRTDRTDRTQPPTGDQGGSEQQRGTGDRRQPRNDAGRAQVADRPVSPATTGPLPPAAPPQAAWQTGNPPQDAWRTDDEEPLPVVSAPPALRFDDEPPVQRTPRVLPDPGPRPGRY